MNLRNKKKIILASKSPRRKQLLEQIGIDFKVCPSNIDESHVLLNNPDQYVKELAWQKAKDLALLYPDSWIIGADTIVVIDDHILGKPKSKNDAVRMLNKLNNREHFVYTAFCICNANSDSKSIKSTFSKTKTISKTAYSTGFAKMVKTVQSVRTKVYFKNLSDCEIDFYVNTKEPFDKAGGYGIQGIGSFMVKKISGSYTNVVGLPVCEVVEELKKFNLIEFIG